jgi:hypothetical protein
MNRTLANIRTLGLVAALLAGVAVANAQTSAPPPAAPPVNTSTPPPPSTPPVDTATPPVNTTPPPIGTPTNDGRQGANRQQDVPRDANGNPLPAAGATANAPPAAPQPLDFGMLDTDKAGAIKLEQARNDPWLRRHFAACDINHNDEVTQSEYEKCTRR